MTPLAEHARDETRERIIAAASALVREQGAAALTTRAVSEAASVQAPTIYRLFGDKNGLIEAVAERAMAAHVSAKTATDGSTDPIAELRAQWRLHIEFGLANPELYALLSTPGRGQRSAALESGIQVLRDRVRSLARAGVLRVGEERALQLIHAAGSGAIAALLEHAPEERDDGLAEAMLDAVLHAILRSGEAPTAADGDASAEATAAAVTLAAHLPDLRGLTAAERTLLAEWIERVVR